MVFFLIKLQLNKKNYYPEYTTPPFSFTPPFSHHPSPQIRYPFAYLEGGGWGGEEGWAYKSVRQEKGTPAVFLPLLRR